MERKKQIAILTVTCILVTLVAVPDKTLTDVSINKSSLPDSGSFAFHERCNDAIKKEAAIISDSGMHSPGPVIDKYSGEKMAAKEFKESPIPGNSIKKHLSEEPDLITKSVDRITNIINKTDMSDRLDKLKKIKEAENVVEKAEKSKLQSDVDKALTIVSELVFSDEKVDFQNRLEVVQNQINYNLAVIKAAAAVESAEKLRTDESIDSAKKLISYIPDGNDKSDLSSRLDKLQKSRAYDRAVSLAVSSVENAEKTKKISDIELARILVNDLDDGIEKSNLSNRLNVVEAILQNTGYEGSTAVSEISEEEKRRINAAAAVAKAEASKQQADMDSARILVDALVDGIEKDSLISRLNQIQKEINDAAEKEKAIAKAAAAVSKAETSKQQADVDSARVLVGILADRTEKNSLTNRLNQIQKEIDDATEKEKAIEKAAAAVSKAETSKQQADVDSARILVGILADGTEKNSFTNRLDQIQKEIDDAAEKEKAIAKAAAAVSKAETSKQQTDVDSARILVGILADGTEKNSFTNRLDQIQKEIDDAAEKEKAIAKAAAAVSKAETSKQQADVDSARVLVGILADGTEKNSLTNRLNQIQKEIDDAAEKEKAIEKAAAAVSKAETSKQQADVDSARILVGILADGTEKNSFTNRLDQIQKEIDDAAEKEKAIAKAAAAVSKAETSKQQVDVDSARILVDALMDGTEKVLLTNRLNEVQNGINYANEVDLATEAVVKAETTVTKADIDAARILVNKLAEGTDKIVLSNRLDKIIKADSKAPTVPQNLKILSVNSTSAVVSWDQSTDNIAVSGYDIYNNNVLTGSVGGDVTMYSINTLNANTEYIITVKAKDLNNNESPESEKLSVTTLLPPPADINYTKTYESVVFQWGENQNFALGKSYNKSEEPDSTYKDINGKESTDGIYAKDFSDGKSYGYKVADNTTKSVDVIVDLAGIYTVNTVRIHKWEGSNNYGADIINIYISQDGANYVQIGNADKTNDIWREATFSNVAARYIKVNFSKYNNGIVGNDWLFVDEIQVYNKIEKEEGNFALGKSYIKSEQPEDSYSDINSKESTDGILAKDFSDGNSYGYRVADNTTKSVDVTIDLGKICSINNIKIHKWEGINNYGADVIYIYASKDGLDYELIGSPNKSEDIWRELSFSAINARYIKVNFNKTNNGDFGNDWMFIDEIKIYDISSSYEVEADGIIIDNGANTTFEANNLEEGSQHTYRIRSKSANNVGEWSDPITIITDSIEEADLICPSQPLNVTASAITLSTVDLNWEASTDNKGVAGYKIYRNSVEVASVNGTSYKDINLDPGILYIYYVKAYDEKGNMSESSEQISVLTN